MFQILVVLLKKIFSSIFFSSCYDFQKMIFRIYFTLANAQVDESLTSSSLKFPECAVEMEIEFTKWISLKIMDADKFICIGLAFKVTAYSEIVEIEFTD